MLRSVTTPITENDVLKAYSSRKYPGNKYPTFKEIYDIVAKRHNVNMATPADARKFEYNTKLKMILVSKKFDLEYSVPLGTNSPSDAERDLVITLFFDYGMGYSPATRYLNLSQYAFDNITNEEANWRVSMRKDKKMPGQSEEEMEYTNKEGDIDAFKFFKAQVRKAEKKLQ